MWFFRKKKTKVYKIKWRFLDYDTFSSGTDIVEAVGLPAAWKKVCYMHRPHDIGIIEWEIVEEG